MFDKFQILAKVSCLINRPRDMGTYDDQHMMAYSLLKNTSVITFGGWESEWQHIVLPQINDFSTFANFGNWWEIAFKTVFLINMNVTSIRNMRYLVWVFPVWCQIGVMDGCLTDAWECMLRLICELFSDWSTGSITFWLLNMSAQSADAAIACIFSVPSSTHCNMAGSSLPATSYTSHHHVERCKYTHPSTDRVT